MGNFMWNEVAVFNKNIQTELNLIQLIFVEKKSVIKNEKGLVKVMIIILLLIPSREFWIIFGELYDSKWNII